MSPGHIRTPDGHYVRSRGEWMIDQWLYMHQIPHAYERMLPADEVAYSDFYIPLERGVYIEYWGKDDDAYLERKEQKLKIYQKEKLDTKLIQITNKDLENLHDILETRLREHGIVSQL